MRGSHRRIIGVLAIASMLMGSAALADQLVIDNDFAHNGNQSDVELTAATGSPVTTSGTVVINHQGSKHMAPSSTVTLNGSSADLPAGFSVGAANVSIPATWGAGSSASGAGSVTFTAPTTPGLYTYHALWTPSTYTCAPGTNPVGSCLGSTAVSLTIKLTVTGSANHAPSMPGAPYLSAGATPNNTGEFTLSWDASTDSDAGDSVTYVLEHKDADDAAYSVVASGLTTNSYAFSAGSPEPEGTWTYRVKAYDGEAYSGYSPVSAPVKVDKTAPNAPVISTNPASPAYVDGTNLWFKDSVTVSAAGNGDPELQDTSAGSGVDSSTLTAPATYSTAGAHTFDTTVKDLATNESVSASLTVNVDPAKPTVAIACPTGVILGAPASASWTASDPTPGSGLATPDSGSISGLDTSTVGSHTATAPAGTARDNVGHDSDAVSCTYTVSYRFLGFFQPINDPAGADYSTFKLGSTVPVKFALTDYSGNRISDAAAQAIADACDAHFSYAVYSSSMPAPVDEPASSNPANTGDCFRYDPAADQFIFNWGTKGRSAMQYTIKARVFSGDTEVAYHDVRVGLR